MRYSGGTATASSTGAVVAAVLVLCLHRGLAFFVLVVDRLLRLAHPGVLPAVQAWAVVGLPLQLRRLRGHRPSPGKGCLCLGQGQG